MEDKFYVRIKKIVELINMFEYPDYLLVFWKYLEYKESHNYELFIDIEIHDQETKTISFILSFDELIGLDDSYDNILRELKNKI